MPNQAPSGQDVIRTAAEDGQVFFVTNDFGFTDTDGNSFAGIVITSLPTGGRLFLNGSPLGLQGQFITFAQLSSGTGLSYRPNLNGNGNAYDSFTFQVRDNGGTADGGADTDPTPNTLTINVTPQPDAPIINNFKATAGGSRLSFVENSGPILLDRGQDATITDIDNTEFDGGCLFVGFPGDSTPYPGYEDFSIAEGNGLTVTSQAVGGLVQYNGTTFGTITVDQDGFLRVDFNAEATLARVQVLLRQLTYQLTDNEAIGGTRNFVLGLKDGDGGERFIDAIPIDLVGVDDPPALTGLDPIIAFSTAAATTTPQIIDASVNFTDPENNHQNSILQISGNVAGDVIGIRNQGNGAGQIGVSGSTISYGSEVIGTFSGGTVGTGPLTVTLGGNASSVAVDALIQNLTYFSTSAMPAASRTMTFFLQNQLGQQISQQFEIRLGTVVAGTAGDDTLTGTAASEIFQGNGGEDAMAGGDDDDVYFVDSAGDTVTEAPGEGHDLVLASVDFALAPGSEVEDLHGFGAGPLSLTGNEFANTIRGTEAGDALSGGGGNDELFGLDGDDTLGGDGESDILRGGNGDDELSGGGGNDFLVGGAGEDAMDGGLGDDTYYVDNAGDEVSEAVGEGSDRVAATVSYVLTAGPSVELLEAGTLASTSALDLTGNALGQTISGNNGVNVLRGDGGNDTLHGQGGNDFMIGGAGDDVAYGGLGDDTYYIGTDDANDVIVEFAGEGRDRISTLISFTLGADVSVEVLEATNSSATNAMDLTGNGLNNDMVGNDGANTLRGGDGIDRIFGYGGVDTLFGDAGDDVLNGAAGDDFLVGGTGADSMEGGAGNDTFYVDNAGDTLIDAVAPGTDRVAASVSYTLGADVDIELLEAVTLSATDAFNFTGNQFGQAIIGNNGANTIDGKGGNDDLTGAGGADIFAFTTAPGAGNVDRILDFVSGTDKTALDDAVFTGLTPGGLPAGAFVTGTQAGDADDRIIYNAATGALLFDADGNGAGVAVQFATLGGHPALAAGDFIVI